jgi:hypothetical protein
MKKRNTHSGKLLERRGPEIDVGTLPRKRYTLEGGRDLRDNIRNRQDVDIEHPKGTY